MSLQLLKLTAESLDYLMCRLQNVLIS